MNRRSFFSTVFGGVLAASVAPFLPCVPAAKPLGLAFHPHAFAMVDKDLGLSIRLVQQFDTLASQRVNRMDVLYGYRDQSAFAFRVEA